VSFRGLAVDWWGGGTLHADTMRPAPQEPLKFGQLAQQRGSGTRRKQRSNSSELGKVGPERPRTPESAPSSASSRRRSSHRGTRRRDVRIHASAKPPDCRLEGILDVPFLDAGADYMWRPILRVLKRSPQAADKRGRSAIPRHSVGTGCPTSAPGYHVVERRLGHPRSAFPRHSVVRDATSDFRAGYQAFEGRPGILEVQSMTLRERRSTRPQARDVLRDVASAESSHGSSGSD
jgi:hypothetical protein